MEKICEIKISKDAEYLTSGTMILVKKKCYLAQIKSGRNSLLSFEESNEEQLIERIGEVVKSLL